MSIARTFASSSKLRTIAAISPIQRLPALLYVSHVCQRRGVAPHKAVFSFGENHKLDLETVTNSTARAPDLFAQGNQSQASRLVASVLPSLQCSFGDLEFHRGR